MTTVTVGDRVAVLDPALAELRAIMRRAGYEPEPNHLGVVERIEDGTAYIVFDDGVSAPYPLHMVRLLGDES